MIAFRAADIEGLVAGLSRELPYTFREIDGRQAFSFVHGEKLVEFLWPQYAPQEIWIALFCSIAHFEAGIADFVMFEEPATEVGQQETLRFLEAVAWRYLKSPTRIRRKWVVFGARRLEYCHGREWKDIYVDE